MGYLGGSVIAYLKAFMPSPLLILAVLGRKVGMIVHFHYFFIFDIFCFFPHQQYYPCVVLQNIFCSIKLSFSQTSGFRWFELSSHSSLQHRLFKLRQNFLNFLNCLRNAVIDWYNGRKHCSGQLKMSFFYVFIAETIPLYTIKSVFLKNFSFYISVHSLIHYWSTTSL